MNHTFLLRLAAAAAAGVTVLPALPAAAAGGPPEGVGRPAAPQVRGLELACPADRVTGGDFADAAGSVHAAAIDCLAFYGVTKGGADGTFGAGKAVTRAQLATFLVRVLDEADVALPAAPADAFSDDEGSAHEGSLDALAELGIVNGAGDGTVSPEAPVRRDQMASFLVRLLELVSDEELAAELEDYFEDTKDSVHRGPINALAGLGIAAGRAKGVFDPSSEVKREQMATFLMRLIDRLVEKGDVRVPASLTLSAEEVSPGDVVTGTVVGDGITGVTLRGCGFDDVVATRKVADAAPEVEADPGVEAATATEASTTVTFTFELTVPDVWPAEQEPVDEEDAPEEEPDDVEEPAVEEPAVEEPAVEEPAVEEPADGSLTVAGRPQGVGGRSEGRGGDEAEEECEFTVLVTFADGETDELEGELEFREVEEEESEEGSEDEAEESDEESREDDSREDDSREDDSREDDSREDGSREDGSREGEGEGEADEADEADGHQTDGDQPATDAPVTDAPVTDAPVTDPVATEPTA